MPRVFYNGGKFKVVFTERAVETFTQLRTEVSPPGLFENLIALIKRFADTGTLHSPEQLNQEGDGFFAIKARGAGLRAYFWYAKLERGVIVVSHIVKKTRKKLDPQDKAIMQGERDTYGR